ncbi:MAG: HD domain-containing protein [Bernardetiaceae bacterium]
MKLLKTIKDPVHGFINIENPLLLKLIDHPYFQRLRRIRQLGISDFVYPGALHTRFHHALGALFLMQRALHELTQKGHRISPEETVAAQVAILLHDVGHGPFSHVLENTILDIQHEEISWQLMEYFNKQNNGSLTVAIQMFRDEYPRHFFHQLISSQLDMDRLDYLQRDRFFTGVSEGNIGVERILKVLDVVDDQLVIHEKGIYNIEHFLNARRMMYWQVYLHKTNVGMEQILTQIMRRVRVLRQQGVEIFATPAFAFFIDYQSNTNRLSDTDLAHFARLDDYDVWASLKVWATHPDPILSHLATCFVERRLFRTELTDRPATEEHLAQVRQSVREQIGEDALDYFLRQGQISNAAYLGREQIRILMRDGSLQNLTDASDLPNIEALMQPVTKYFLWYPKREI